MGGLSRRAFLQGTRKPAENVPDTHGDGPVAIGPECLALNRVVCRSCAEHCEAHAIHFRLAPGGIAIPLLRPERCDGCGICIPACPTSAITLQPAAVSSEGAA